MDRPVHLYAHIPFCPTKCDYCAFVTHIGSLKFLDPYMEALETEVGRAAASRPGGPLLSIYFGGGTPSMAHPEQIASFVDCSREIFGLQESCEISLESHPLTIDAASLKGFQSAGVTRLSFGAESLDSGELQRLGRRHSADRIFEVVSLAREAGISNVNVDLMYGLPGQSPASWERTLTLLLASQPEHISLYPLSIEPRTVYDRRRRRNDLQLPQDDEVVQMYHIACVALRGAGYDHYEVANWARPGMKCVHNLAYWQNSEFFAVGVGAHGYLKPYRTENLRQTSRYIEKMAAGHSVVVEQSLVDEAQEFSDTVMLRLRLLESGLNLREISDRFDIDMMRDFAADIQELQTLGLLEKSGMTLLIPESAVPLANEVWQRFIM